MNWIDRLPPTATRVEHATAAEVNRRLRNRADGRLETLEARGPDQIDARIDELSREWDIERALQANAGAFALAGVALGWGVDRRFLMLPLAVFAFFAQHALQGWCPPVPVMRRLGVRTRREIERERYALKTMRGDFDQVPASDQGTARQRVRAALEAVDA